MKSSISRTNHGAIMGLVIVCTLFAIILGIAFFQICMLIGGSREVTNAVDAGTLNTGREATTVTVDIQSGSAEDQFSDVAENGKSFSLKSINRMWAKCLICMMNQQAMGGSSTGQSSSHAQDLFKAASAISQRLSQKLNQASTLYPFFTDVVAKESVRMLGNSAGVVYDTSAGGWETSLMDRGTEGNVAIYQDQLPGSFNLTGVNAVKASDGKYYFSGYKPINILGQYVTFVPFKLNYQPHLVSNVDFAKDKGSSAPIANYNSPVPNAFSCMGVTQSQTHDTQHSKSYVLTNPQVTYDTTLPHSFIHIKLDSNTSHFNCNGTPYPIYDQSYNYIATVTQSGPMAAGFLGEITATTTVGLEFIPPTVWQALTALPTGDYGSLKTALTQRCDEMKHGFQESDVESVLSTLVIPGIKDYYVYPDGSGKIKASALPPSWKLGGGDGDGQESDICSNTGLTPNFTVAVFGGIGGAGGFCMESDDVYWTPGTGYDGCLGSVRATHDTTSYVFGGGAF